MKAEGAGGTSGGGAGENPAAVEIVYYTDPLCCWSWALEPQWRLLLHAFAGRLAFRYRMGGLVKSWADYEDPVNAVHRPGQMGPLWLEARHLTGMPVDAGIWIGERPHSSWPACLAVKAAERQSPMAADLYLRRLREAVMLERRNIASDAVLAELAQDLSATYPGLLDPDRLVADTKDAAVRAQFEDDVKTALFRGVRRFPALNIRRPGTAGLLLVGWRPYRALLQAVSEVAPEAVPRRPPASQAEYRAFWPRAIPREWEEARAAGEAEPAVGEATAGS